MVKSGNFKILLTALHLVAHVMEEMPRRASLKGGTTPAAGHLNIYNFFRDQLKYRRIC